ncbi:MAG: O-antigen ligase family protein [Candidatus Kerfeldbacteria bacterium]|nr:O-antigen ligase family protein [Candidatus Kerfeldbacteria bacterium]
MQEKQKLLSFFRMGFMLASVEVASFLAWQMPSIAWFCFVYVLLRVAYASYKDLRVGVAVVAVELIISSQGYMFAVSVGGFHASIRLGLFLVLIVMAAVHALRTRSIVLLRMPWFRWYVGVLCVIAYGVCVAVARHYSLSGIFFDVNAWLFLGLAFPLTQALRTREDLRYMLKPIIFALWWLFGKTLIIAIIFSHPLATQPVSTIAYLWLRDTRIAEIFRFPSGFARVFLQSHIYALVAMGVLYIRLLMRKESLRPYRALFFAMIFTVLLSYSRTFWLMGGCVLAVVTIVLCIQRRAEWRRLFSRILLTLWYTALAIVCIVVMVRIPLPRDTAMSGSLFSERVTSVHTEAAAMTRLQEFGPLFRAITQHPLIGAGFGATVTYTSADPRIMASHADGVYTTSAFEFGYLDLWLKVGGVGVLYITVALLFLVYVCVRWYYAHNDLGALVCGVAILLVMSVHALTPYINHPLGLGILLGALVYISIPFNRHI